MQQNLNTKVYLNIRARMVKLEDGEQKEATHTFYSGVFEIFPGSDLEDMVSQMKDTILERFTMMELAVRSGWTLLEIVDVKMHFANFKPLSGSSYVKLPKIIVSKHAVVNIENKTDNECFEWAVTRALNPIDKHAGRITKRLKERSRIFDWSGVNFPTTFDDISVF